LADLSDWESLRVQLNLPQVEESEVAVESYDITALPVESPDDVEEIIATEWPDSTPEANDESDPHDSVLPADVDVTVSSN